MRKQISWWLRGRDHTQAALDDQGAAIGELQQQVAELGSVVARIDPLATRAAEDVDGLLGELRAAVDDLSARIGALSDRVDQGRS